jgi:hypothetical protein
MQSFQSHNIQSHNLYFENGKNGCVLFLPFFLVKNTEGGSHYIVANSIFSSLKNCGER